MKRKRNEKKGKGKPRGKEKKYWKAKVKKIEWKRNGKTERKG